MARSRENPAHGAFSQFRCEEATVTVVDRDKHTVTVETRHSAKTVPDLQVGMAWASPDGDGITVMPDVGAICHVAWPNDNTPPYIQDFIGAPSARGTDEGTGDSPTIVTFNRGRPRMNPGDIALHTRDKNHLILRRGGVIEIGATPVSKRIYLPIRNYIKDFFENYAAHSPAGSLEWTVARRENDPGGQAASSWVLHLNEFAQDEKATVRIRHLPLAAPGSSEKAAWEVEVAPQGINRDDGSVSSSKYRLLVTTAGDQVEVIGASRDITVEGDDSLTIRGSGSVDVTGDYTVDARGDVVFLAQRDAVLAGVATTKLGGRDAASPGMKGDTFLEWAAGATWVVSGTAATLSPASLTALARVLSDKVFLK